MNPTPEQTAALVRYAAKQLGMSPDALLSAVKNGDLPDGVGAVLNDPQRRAALLNDPAVKQLMQRFLGGNKYG